MKKRVFAVLFAAQALVLPTASSGQDHNSMGCPGSAIIQEDHESLIKHAIYAELAYVGSEDTRSRYNCRINGSEGYECSGVPKSPYCQSPNVAENAATETLTVKLVDELLLERAKRAYMKRHGEQAGTVHFHTEDGEEAGGDTFYICTHAERPETVLAAAAKWIGAGTQVFLKFSLGLGRLTYEEEVEILEIEERLDRSSIMPVQGTQADRFEQWISSVNELLGDSCIFELSTEVAAEFFRYNEISPRRPGVLTGHSLGGSVVQYIMANGMRDECGNILSLQDNVTGYSFNSFGFSGVPTLGQEKMWSAVVDDEVLDTIFGTSRTQTGNVYIYDVDTGRSDRRNRANPDSALGPIDRHKISTVQRLICECLMAGEDGQRFRSTVR